ncbi:MAG: GNAT family N-acetyltransferase [Pseudomonadota bacterium]
MADILQTARLTLRPMRMEDAPALHGFFSDPIAMAYWSKPHATFEETEAWVRGTVEAPASQTREYSILLGEEVVGKAGLWKSPELGYFLRRDHWGKGYMPEALTTLIPHLHREMCEVMTAEVTPGNTPSLSLLADMGFKETHRGEKDYWDGTAWIDTIYLQRTATDPILVRRPKEARG